MLKTGKAEFIKLLRFLTWCCVAPRTMCRLKLCIRFVLSDKIASPIFRMTPPFVSLKIGWAFPASSGGESRRAWLVRPAAGTLFDVCF
jgi:hypothetical protein